MKYWLAIIFFVLLKMQGALFAQGRLETDTIRLKDVELFGIRNKEKDQLKSVHIDSAMIANHQSSTLADLLAQSTVYVKNYGSSMLALPGFRGTAGDHTKLYWNGISLNSSMYGLQDLNLVPVFLLDGVDINYGGASITGGSGGFGGSLNLESNNYKTVHKLELSSAIGSFGTYKEGLGASYGTGKWWAATKAYYNTAQNNFPYINTFKWNSPQETEQDAAMHQYGIMQMLGFEVSDKDVLKADLWYQNSYRNLPQTMISGANHEYQADESFRSNLSWRHYEKSNQYGLDASYVKEYLFYHNEIADINSPAWNSRYELKGSYSSQFKIPLSLKAGLEDAEETVQIKEYQGLKMRNMSGIWADGCYDISKKWRSGLVTRLGSADFRDLQYAFAASLAFKPLDDERLVFHLNDGHNFNYPNLNDLYWYPGGNPDLKPENTWFGETGISSALKIGKMTTLKPELTFFSNFIDNYILWTPAGGSLWQAKNLKKVWARGFESAINVEHRMKTLNISFKIAYQYTPSTDQSLTSLYDQNFGRQLIYIPQHTAQALLRVGIKKFEFTAEYTYTGPRNTTDQELGSYALVNIFAGRNFSYKNVNINILAKCNNVFNESYQAIIWRPIPGRWFELSLKITLLGY
jgi:outer membrane cobalamin receptor